MKMTKEHFDHMEKTITERHNELKTSKPVQYAEYINSGHSSKRMRWDMLYGAGLTRFVCDTLYTYLDDDHIDTALRNIDLNW